MADFQFAFDYLGLSPAIFTYPAVLTNLVIPFLFFTYALYLLQKRLGIFSSDAVHTALAVVISLASVVLISSAGPWITALSIFLICTFEFGGGLKGAGLGILLALLSLVLIPYLLSLVPFSQ